MTFAFAMRRDRKSRATDIALKRAEEVRNCIEEFIFNDHLLKMIRITKEGIVDRYKSSKNLDREDIRDYRRIENQQDFEINKARAEQMKLFAKANILVALSYHEGISAELISEMGKTPLNLDAVASKAAAYIDAEMSRIMEGRRAKITSIPQLNQTE